jgi:hypothetical protein
MNRFSISSHQFCVPFLFNWIWIQFKFDKKWIKLNFHKINPFFYQLINWLLLVLHNNAKLKLVNAKVVHVLQHNIFTPSKGLVWVVLLCTYCKVVLQNTHTHTHTHICVNFNLPRKWFLIFKIKSKSISFGTQLLGIDYIFLSH